MAKNTKVAIYLNSEFCRWYVIKVFFPRRKTTVELVGTVPHCRRFESIATHSCPLKHGCIDVHRCVCTKVK